ncbi:hypothetical protein [Aurantimonas sp. Leaf443]|uniref:hypothetical protein n=1 Tax=Aurantimonas sp. Leaf443 TaxID=1736378 RepID=UPI00070181DE|nr:hypothetical protein [Aurantimonas sp. Leaf443]KQT85876.1 hypothetical protein ASG48_04510 [Aurantimonas sp. Leaf443]
MAKDEGIEAARSGERGGGMVRASVLFALVAVILCLLAAPAIDGRVASLNERMAPAIDMITTGSIAKGPAARRYNVRRSVLQEPGAPACIVDHRQQRFGSTC